MLGWRPGGFDFGDLPGETDAVKVSFDRAMVGDGGYDLHSPTTVWTSLLRKLAHHYDRETRGGPLLNRPGSGGGWIWIRAAQRKMLGGYLNVKAGSKPAGYFVDTKLTLILRLARLELELFELSHRFG